MEALKLEEFGVQELDSREIVEVEGGIAPLLIVAGIYVGAAVTGAAAGYGLYKLVDWVAN